MDESDGTANLKIAKCRKPAWLNRGLTFNPPADGLDYEDVRKPCENGVASRTQALRFTSDESQYGIEPLHLVRVCGADVNNPRKLSDQLISCRMIKSHIHANQMGTGAASALTKKTVALVLVFTFEIFKSSNGTCQIIHQRVLVSVGKENQISGFKLLVRYAFAQNRGSRHDKDEIWRNPQRTAGKVPMEM